MEELYQTLVECERKKLIKDCEIKIEDYKTRIIDLQNEIECIKFSSNWMDEYSTNDALTDVQDQKMILYDMQQQMTKKDFNNYTNNLLGLFAHIDNIRFMYKECGLVCPEWFTAKYFQWLK